MNRDTIEYESIIFEIFAGLDVVLILVGPVQLHFLTLIRNGIHTFLVTALGHKVAILIVAVEERI